MEDTEAIQYTLLDNWHTSFKKGTDFDLWGQPVEAIECFQKVVKGVLGTPDIASVRREALYDGLPVYRYHDNALMEYSSTYRLSAQLRHYVKSSDNIFSDEHKKILGKIAACLDLRSKSLQQPGKMEDISLDDLKKVEKRLKNLVSERSRDFPVEVSGITLTPVSKVRTPRHGIDEDRDIDDTEEVVVTVPKANNKPKKKWRYNDDEKEDPYVEKSMGTLLPPPEMVPGKTIVTLRVEKIGLKDASQYIDPFITITVKDIYGSDITAAQDTPLASYKEDTFVFFGCDAYLQKPLEYLPLDFAIFFEFKHYKPKKKSISTKCWSFIEKDEIREGQVVVELYKKPACYRRKKINLLTVKPLYLHLKLTFN